MLQLKKTPLEERWLWVNVLDVVGLGTTFSDIIVRDNPTIKQKVLVNGFSSTLLVD
jgi:hypothetical protein